MIPMSSATPTIEGSRRVDGAPATATVTAAAGAMCPFQPVSAGDSAARLEFSVMDAGVDGLRKPDDAQRCSDCEGEGLVTRWGRLGHEVPASRADPARYPDFLLEAPDVAGEADGRPRTCVACMGRGWYVHGDPSLEPQEVVPAPGELVPRRSPVLTATSTPAPSRRRADVSKRVRFEVFKRDCFQCQYCGASAPTVVLHVDHIHPVAAGGDNDLVNLVTSCEPCNLGKGARVLTDDAAVGKSKRQLELLQERREQQEMMFEWKSELQASDDLDVDRLRVRWNDLAPGWILSESGLRSLRTLYRKFGFADVWDAMESAADHYLVFDGAERVTRESWSEAFSKVGGIAKRRADDRSDPEGSEWRKAVAVLAKRMSYVKRWQIGNLLAEARALEIAVDEVWKLARLHGFSWSKFRDNLTEWINEARKSGAKES